MPKHSLKLAGEDQRMWCIYTLCTYYTRNEVFNIGTYAYCKHLKIQFLHSDFTAQCMSELSRMPNCAL